jgi:hypothetical protein
VDVGQRAHWLAVHLEQHRAQWQTDSERRRADSTTEPYHRQLLVQLQPVARPAVMPQLDVDLFRLAQPPRVRHVGRRLLLHGSTTLLQGQRTAHRWLCTALIPHEAVVLRSLALYIVLVEGLQHLPRRLWLAAERLLRNIIWQQQHAALHHAALYHTAAVIEVNRHQRHDAAASHRGAPTETTRWPLRL